jgi:predicted dehydrogenase
MKQGVQAGAAMASLANEPLRFGVLGAARIAPRALIEPAAENPRAHVVVVAARDPVRAAAFAKTNDIPEALSDYRSVIENPGVDAIYNALPPALHAPLCIEAVAAGKHVLCEKPFAMNARQAEDMVKAGERYGCVVMEAVHSRYHPLFLAVMEIVASGRLGRLSRLDALFTANIPATAQSLRHDPALGGGALMDLGTYCVHWCRAVAGREPSVIGVDSRRHQSGVDLRTHAELDFGEGLTAGIDCAMDEDHRTALSIIGSEGSLVVENPLIPHRPHKLVLTIGDRSETRTFTRRTTYAFQLDAFLDAVAGDRARMLVSGRDSIANMAVIDEIYAKAGYR